jgi:lysophospholipase L1-like esterase
MRQVVYLANSGSPNSRTARESVDVVCAGDSLTGWNNYGPEDSWPFPTYPRFLQEMCEPLGLALADGGIAGEVSGRGLWHVERYLELFPNARYFIIGFGTNDLGGASDHVAVGARVIQNLRSMVEAVRNADKLPMLFNVPYVNEGMLPSFLAEQLREQRDYHNSRLAEYCADNEVPLADICARLESEHFGDEVHPNEAGARIIAECVFEVLKTVSSA